MKRNALIKGTFILTLASFLSRFIGFFYRIFLSRMFGEEGMGIYELMNPVLTLTFALCTSGIQSAISKFVAGEPEKTGSRNRLRILLTGLVFSGMLSVLCAALVYQGADFIASTLLMEERCAPLLRIASLSFPAACIHSCINGYFYGIKKAGLPAFCQLFEQCFRVGSVFLFWNYASSHGIAFSITVAAVGLVIGEFASTLVSIPATWLHFVKLGDLSHFSKTSWRAITSRIFLFAAPLSANRVCLHLLGAVESARIPVSLQQFGYTQTQAISIYGVFTGMAMTCIHFPAAFTNSVSVLLMPLIAEADARKNTPAIRTAILKCIRYCLLLGGACMALFLLTGNFLGTMLFHSELAGHFIRTLSFICPLFYLNPTLFSILNGLGKTGHTFLLNMSSLLIRLAFVLFVVPNFGIEGFLWGMLAGQFVTTACCFALLRPFITQKN
ncbi:MAG: polysaccharide biosynthesis protein [Eubacteriales bacterium]|nr:polysaccharide biosynthesis protein [Eubacteriales bacterium]